VRYLAFRGISVSVGSMPDLVYSRENMNHINVVDSFRSPSQQHGGRHASEIPVRCLMRRLLSAVSCCIKL